LKEFSNVSFDNEHPKDAAAMATMLSIVIPSYLGKRTIVQTLESLRPIEVFSQIIVVENGSDELDESLQSLLRPGLPFELYKLKHADLSRARNFGLTKAKGEFVWFLDADDICTVGKLGSQLTYSLKNQVSILVMPSVIVPDDSLSELRDPIIYGQSRTEALDTLPREMSGSEFLATELVRERYSPVIGRYMFHKAFLQAQRLEFTEGFIHEDHSFVAKALLKAPRIALTQDGSRLLKRVGHASLSSVSSAEKSVGGYMKARSEIHQFDCRPSDRLTISLLKNRLFLASARRNFSLLKRTMPERFMGLLVFSWAALKYLSVRAVVGTRLFRLKVFGH
jgi:hypothetical protein